MTDVTILDLPAVSIINPVTDVLPIVSGGVTSKISAQNLLYGSIPSQTGQTGKSLLTDGTTLYWGENQTPGGVNAQIQFNNNGVFGGFTMGGDGTLDVGTGYLTVTGSQGSAFGDMAFQNSDAVSILGGSISGVSGNGPGFLANWATNVADGARNQLVYQTDQDTTGFVAAPTVAGSMLMWNGTSIGWSTNATAANLAGGQANSIPFQHTPGETAFIDPPSGANQILKFNGFTFSWVTDATGTVTSVDGSGGTTGLTLTGGPITSSGTLTLGGTLAPTSGGTGLTAYAAGDLVVATAANTLGVLNAGTNGYVLTMTGGVPTWAAAGGGGLAGITAGVTPFTTALGVQAGDSVTTGPYNTAVGYQAGTAITNSAWSTFVGGQAGVSSNGNANTGVGFQALFSNLTGASNVAVGNVALRAGTAASNNVGIGDSAGQNCTGSSNVFVGASAGDAVSTLTLGVLIGYGAGGVSTSAATGVVGIGNLAFNALTTGANNCGVGNNAGYSQTTGSRDTYLGWGSGYTNVSGNDNTYVGYYAGRVATGGQNTFVGSTAGDSVTTGTANTFVGFGAGTVVTTGLRNTLVGAYQGTTGLSDVVALSDGAGNIRLYMNSFGALSVDGVDFGTAGQIFTSAGPSAAPQWVTGGGGGGGTVTSVDVVGGTTGLTTTGGPVMDSGTITLGGVLNPAHGGTGLSTVGTDGQVLGLVAGAPAWVNASNNLDGRTNEATPFNTALGFNTLAAVTSGNSNTCVGYDSGATLTLGSKNTMLGYQAGQNHDLSDNGTYIGYQAGNGVTTGAYNTLVGANAGKAITSGDHNTVVGNYAGTATEAGTVVLATGDGHVRFFTNTAGAMSVDGTNFGNVGQALLSAGNAAAPAWGNVVTSVNAVGGTTGLTFSGGPITTSGTLTLAGTLAIANGGTGATTAAAARTALLPSQSGQANKVLGTNGTDVAWVDQSGGGSSSVTVPATGGAAGYPGVVRADGSIAIASGFNATVSVTMTGVPSAQKATVAANLMDADGTTVLNNYYAGISSTGGIVVWGIQSTDNGTTQMSMAAMPAGSADGVGITLLVRASNSLLLGYFNANGTIGISTVTFNDPAWTVQTKTSSTAVSSQRELAYTMYSADRVIFYYWKADGMYESVYIISSDSWMAESKMATIATPQGPIKAVRQDVGDYILAPQSGTPNTVYISYVNINGVVSGTSTWANCLPYKGVDIAWSSTANCLIAVMNPALDGSATTPSWLYAIGLADGLSNSFTQEIPLTRISDFRPNPNNDTRYMGLVQRGKSGQYVFGYPDMNGSPRMCAFFVDANGKTNPQIFAQGQIIMGWGISAAYVNRAAPGVILMTGKYSIMVFANSTSGSLGNPFAAQYICPNVTPNNVAGIYQSNTQMTIQGIVTKSGGGLVPGVVYGVRGKDSSPYWEILPLDNTMVRIGKALTSTTMLVN